MGTCYAMRRSLDLCCEVHCVSCFFTSEIDSMNNGECPYTRWYLIEEVRNGYRIVLNPFKFKGSQLASRLGGDSWVSWHLESEGKREVFRSAKEDHTVYVREEAATKETLEERHVALLKTLGLNDGD